MMLLQTNKQLPNVNYGTKIQVHVVDRLFIDMCIFILASMKDIV